VSKTPALPLEATPLRNNKMIYFISAFLLHKFYQENA
jgi:hypothetical protein